MPTLSTAGFQLGLWRQRPVPGQAETVALEKEPRVWQESRQTELVATGLWKVEGHEHVRMCV